MADGTDDREALQRLEGRILKMLPDTYQQPDEDVQPVPMRSAGLTFQEDGTVAWDRMWGSFCDLAMAGGPPHKGSLLEPGLPEEIAANQGRYEQVVEEICRGITLAAGLEAARSSVPGWVRVECLNADMAGWLVRAITMENVAVHCDGAVLLLPAGPGYRLEKEIKNVITVIAKTCHYWRDHMGWARRETISELFAEMEREEPLIQPALMGNGFDREQREAEYKAQIARMAEALRPSTGLDGFDHRFAGWLGVDCGSVSAALWLMRAMVAGNVLARREGTVLFVPVNPKMDPEGTIVVQALADVLRLVAQKTSESESRQGLKNI